MPYADFYNLNSEIVYPFAPPAYGAIRTQDGSKYLPAEAILDCGFWLGAGEDYDPEEDIVYLDSITRLGAQLTFLFTSTSGSTFSAVRYQNDEIGAVSYAESSSGADAGVCFVATGDLSGVFDMVADGTTENIYRILNFDTGLIDSDAVVEPALVQAEARTSLLSLTIANLDSIADRPCDGCGTAATLDETAYVQTGGDRLTGDLTFAPGYNMLVSLNEADSVITLSPSYGSGMGVLCGSPPARHAGDDPDAGERCGDLIYTINGVSPTEGGAFGLQGSAGIGVTPDSADNAIEITGQIDRLLVCQDEEE